MYYFVWVYSPVCGFNWMLPYLSNNDWLNWVSCCVSDDSVCLAVVCLSSNCILSVKNITDVSMFNEIENKYNVMFLKGGLQADYGQNVASPGDVVVASTIKQLTEVFTKVDPQTLVMIIKNND